MVLAAGTESQMSKDDEKTREQLLAELRQLRREVARRDAVAARTEPTRRPGSYDAVIKAIAAHVPITLFALDGHGNITLSEGLGLQALGLESGEMVGRNVLEEFHFLPDIKGQLDRALYEVSACTNVESRPFAASRPRRASVRARSNSPWSR